MKLEFDTEQTTRWLVGHLRIVLPLSLVFASWFSMHQAVGAGEAIGAWWGIMSFFLGFGGLISAAAYWIGDGL